MISPDGERAKVERVSGVGKDTPSLPTPDTVAYSEAVRQRIDAATDPERLRAALRQVLHIKAPEELQL